MKRALLIFVLVVLAAGTASAKLGDLVASFDNHPVGGGSNHYGLAADRTYLYSFYYTTGYHVYRMLRSNGSLVSSYPCPLGTTSPAYYCRGMSYGGGTILYINNYSQRRVGRFYASTGSLISTWTWPSGTRYGICCTHDGTNYGTRIWQSYLAGTFWQSTTTGSLISSFDIANTYNYDDAWDYGNNMIWFGNYSTDYIYGMRTSGSILASWRGPTAVSNPYGVAYYGSYLYVSTSYGSPDEYIWVYHCPNTVGVAPASVGKVKALFK